jgi:hypothetical protein
MFSQNRNQPILTEFRGCFPHAEVLIEKRKKGATFFHGICWNFLTIRRKLNELKIINDGNPLIIYTLFSPLYADVRQLRVV